MSIQGWLVGLAVWDLLGGTQQMCGLLSCVVLDGQKVERPVPRPVSGRVQATFQQPEEEEE